MSEHLENKNLWAEKLQQSSLPDVADQWQSMQGLLDAKMPVEKSKDWRRWLLLIILLLLLIGVCNCPGIKRTSKFSEKNNLPVANQTKDNKNVTERKENSSSVKTGDSISMKNGSKINDIDSGTKIQNEEQQDLKKENQKKNVDSKNGEPIDSIKNNNPSTHGDDVNEDDKTVERKNNRKKSDVPYSTKQKNSYHKRANKNRVEDNLNDEGLAISKSVSKKINKQEKNTNADVNSVNNVSEQNQHNDSDSSEAKKTSVPSVSDSSSKIKKIDTVNKKQSAINQPSKKKTDSVDKKNKRIALVAGLGLNQFFTVGSQQHSDYNSSGTSDVLSDYIPVPVVRAYINKNLYIQLEAQFNTPQYTKKLLASQVIKSDTNVSPITTQTSVFIKKLFYFNIPLSIHYSPFKNIYVGAGLQFSRLTNGVGLFEGTQYNSSTNDTLTTSKIASFKSDSVYKEIKTNEFRFLFDANYQWKNLVLGVRYNQSFNNFINVQISSTQITQARNSSVQLYLRYILWKNKKAKELFSK